MNGIRAGFTTQRVVLRTGGELDIGERGRPRPLSRETELSAPPRPPARKPGARRGPHTRNAQLRGFRSIRPAGRSESTAPFASLDTAVPAIAPYRHREHPTASPTPRRAYPHRGSGALPLARHRGSRVLGRPRRRNHRHRETRRRSVDRSTDPAIAQGGILVRRRRDAERRRWPTSRPVAGVGRPRARLARMRVDRPQPFTGHACMRDGTGLPRREASTVSRRNDRT
jgi:hypothetical protein